MKTMFKNSNDYWEFSNSVRSSGRYAQNTECQTFLDIFRNGVKQRSETLKKGTKLFRAVGHYVEDSDCEEGQLHITGSSSDRIFPKVEHARDGRINPKGILALYLASSKETAVSEIRPYKGQGISIAMLSIIRDLKIANLTTNSGKSTLNLHLKAYDSNSPKMSDQDINECVWIDIDNAFSRPTSRADTSTEYVPTQILAEVLKDEGFDGVFYKSAFGGKKKGYNIALFNINDAKILWCNAFSVDDIKIDFSEIGNAWIKKQEGGK